MPRPEYTPMRRHIMTAIVWLVLGATIAMAAVVTAKQKKLSRVDLAKPTLVGGNVSVRLPAKWRARPRGEGDVRVVAQAAEGTSGEEGRELRVLSERIESPMSPLQYLATAFGMRVPSKLDAPSAAEVTTIEIAGYPGIMIIEDQTTPQFDLQGAPPRRKEIYGCAILPSLQAITVHMTGGEADDDIDADMVRQIARAVTVTRPPELEQPGTTIMLPDGISFAPPARAAAVALNDPNRVERRLWMTESPTDSAQQREAKWLVIEALGVLFPPTDMMDGSQRERALNTLQTLLLVRDQRWRGAEATIESGVYRIDSPAEHNLFPARAYLVPHDSGRGLLVIFHGGYGSDDEFDAAWAQMSKSIKFLPTPGNARLEEVGAAEALRLRSLKVTALIPDRNEQWWLWTDPSDRPLRGWTHVEMAANGASFNAESRIRRWGGRVVRIQEEWSVNGVPVHAIEVTRTLLASDNSDLESVRQKVDVNPGLVSLNAQSRTMTLAAWKVQPPAQYIPGAVLPQVIGRLTPDPMLLKSESFVGSEAVGTPLPLDIIVRPSENLAGKTDDTQPLRCMTVQVNGTGVLSRWYIREDDTIARIEFADGVQCTPSDKKAIGFSFAKDGQMSLK